MFNLIDKLEKEHNLTNSELLKLIKCEDKMVLEYLYQKADKVRQEVYGKDVYIRGLIEISNYCKNNCFYCGIRAENKSCERYRLSKDEILFCIKENYPKGFKTFVLQGGEDTFFSDDILCEIIREIKHIYPDVCVTLSLGERTKESFQKLYDAGAERYLLRHETVNKEHYEKLHPEKMSYDNRMECLKNLKEIGYQTGCGLMVGSPYQTLENLVEDLRFVKDFNPEMCGIGPFIPHKNTPFKDFKQGDLTLTLKMLAIVRLLVPDVLLPATTALATISENGRELGLKSGTNVIMPNLLPIETAKKYSLYNDKFHEESDTEKLKSELEKMGYHLAISRGDIIRNTHKQNLLPLLGGGQGGGCCPPTKPLLQNARNLRKNSTKQERKMWSILRNHQFYGLEFKRQYIIGNYIVDFICKNKKLIIELDGGQHNEPENIVKDNERTKFLEARGYKVIRIWNNDIDKNLQGVYKNLMNICGIDKPPPQPSPEEREHG